MRLKKISKSIIALAMVAIVSLGVIVINKTTTSAAAFKGTAKGTQVEVNEDGTASVTYSFSTADGAINGLAGVFSWDETLLELDGAPVADNMVMTDWGPTAGKREFNGLINNPGATCGVTFNFKNVKLDANTTTAAVKFEFADVDLSHLGLGHFSEFYDNSWNPMLPSEIDYTEATITYNVPVVPVSVVLDVKSATVEAGKTHQFKATVANDPANAGVEYAVAGAKSKDTKIDANGLLTVGADETSTTLTVTATSKTDKTATATATVTVTVKKPSTAPGTGTSKPGASKPGSTNTGSTKPAAKPSTSPNTGDTTNVAGLSLLALSMLGLVVVVKKTSLSK